MCIKSGLGGFSSLSPLVISHNGLAARLMAILSPPAGPRCHLRPDILLSDRPFVFLEPAEEITAVQLLWRDNDTTRAAKGQSRPRVAVPGGRASLGVSRRVYRWSQGSGVTRLPTRYGPPLRPAVRGECIVPRCCQPASYGWAWGGLSGHARTAADKHAWDSQGSQLSATGSRQRVRRTLAT